MKIFAIKDEELEKSETLGYLLYYEKSRCFYIELPDNADPWKTPMPLSSFLQRGEHTVNAYWSKIWVQQRIVPPDRQNLGQVLKANGLAEYDEFALLMLAHGKCAQDSYYLEEVDKMQFPDSLKERWKRKIEDIVPITHHGLLVFFRDGTVKKCDIEALEAGVTRFAPILRNTNLFNRVMVQIDGYGVSWGEEINISNDKLYENGVDVPLSLDDFISFIANRVVNTAEASEILGCSRQYIDELTKKGAIHPIREDARNRLFLKNELQQRISH